MNMDEKKFAFILCGKNREQFLHTLTALQEIEIPKGFHAELVEIYGDDNLAVMYNEAVKQSQAKYKIYIQNDVAKMSHRLLHKILESFATEPKAAVLGLQGSDLPADGDYLNAQERYGSCFIKTKENEIIDISVGKSVLFSQDVQTLDDSFFVTRQDKNWDENMAGPFLLIAYCANLIKDGYKVITVEQNLAVGDIWVAFVDKCNVDFWRKHREKFEEYRQIFVGHYSRNYLPLVSILIPAYNEAIFFEQALKSALAQTYKHIEIVIGDDSTNDDIYKLLQSYMRKYDNIKYYRHKKPLGKRGWNNMEFLLHKSQGKYINILMQDDLLKEHKIAKMMDYYLRDLNGEIGIITSDRYKIDSKGSILGIVNGWQGQPNRIITGKEIGKKLLKQGYNFIGEFSTVLVPRNLKYDEVRRLPIWSTYYGYKEYSMADLSTWLQIASNGKKVVLLSECLSAFRVHDRQKTNVDVIQITTRLDWLALYLLSWQHNSFDVNEDECFYLMREFISRNQLCVDEISISEGEKTLYERYCNILKENGLNNKRKVFEYIFEYIQ